MHPELTFWLSAWCLKSFGDCGINTCFALRNLLFSVQSEKSSRHYTELREWSLAISLIDDVGSDLVMAYIVIKLTSDILPCSSNRSRRCRHCQTFVYTTIKLSIEYFFSLLALSTYYKLPHELCISYANRSALAECLQPH